MYQKRILKHRLNEKYYLKYQKILIENDFYVAFPLEAHELIQKMCRH